MSAIKGTKPLMSINGKEINATGGYEIPFKNEGSFSFFGTFFNPIIDMPPLPRRCEIISGGLFRRRTFSFLANMTDFQNGEITGNIIGKFEDKTEFTRLFNALVTVGYVLSCLGFIYFGI